VAIDVLMVACCANAVLVVLQELKIWNPFPGAPYRSVGLLGNPNDVGMFLVTPAVVALVLALVTSSARRRMFYAGIAVLLVAGVLASGSRTALIAFVAGVVIFALGQGRHAALGTAAVLAIVFLGLSRPSTAIGRGARDFIEAARSRDYERLSSERLVPFLAALDMTRDHPLLGTGPGCFKYQYMTYRVALRDRYPKEWTRGWPMNWGEVHNDHLQVAAETGLPGYALFLAAIGVAAGIVGRGRRRTDAATPEAAFARALRWPLATVVFVICLAQFPLELAAPRLMLLMLGALCMTWDRDDAA
jgi:O-antigen ligase